MMQALLEEFRSHPLAGQMLAAEVNKGRLRIDLKWDKVTLQGLVEFLPDGDLGLGSFPLGGAL